MLVNKEWENTFGQPHFLDWSGSFLDQAGDMITTGNNYVSSVLTELLVTKQNTNGDILWQQTYKLSNSSSNYGVQACTDQYDFIYVVGAAKSNSAPFHDMVFLKYDPSGNLLWSQIYDGGKEDAAIAVTCTPDGSAVFVTGSSGAPNTLPDFMTLRLDGASGTIDWDKRYNHTSNLYDVPIGISLDGSNLLVLGGSAPSVSDVDFFGIKYDLSGNFVDSFRLSNPGFNFDQPTSLAKDVLGNFYVTGSTSTASNGTDIRTVKLDDNLNVVWNQTLDVASGNDRAASVQVDASGCVFLCGFGTLNGKKSSLIAKYDASGAILWNRSFGQGVDHCEAIKGKLDAQGYYNVVGQSTKNGNSHWQIYKFNGEGDLLWSGRIDGSNGGEIEKPTDIILASNGDLLVTGIKEVNGVRKYATVRYEWFVKDDQLALDTFGDPSYVANQLIVAFNPSIVDIDFINDKQRFFADFDEVLSTTFLSDPRLTFDRRGLKLVKIYNWMTTADSLSITRLGDTIPVPKFWASLLLVADSTSIVEINSCLESMDDFIEHTEYNLIAKLYTNDPLYSSQVSLNFLDFGMEDSWNYSTGESNVVVNVNGTKVFYTHEDFVNSNGNRSRIKAGFDYGTNSDLFNIDPNSGNAQSWNHETAMAGIIGANRNNSIGIAGIAGGGQFTNGQGNDEGVTITNSAANYGNYSSFSPAHQFYNSIAEAAYGKIQTPNFTIEDYPADIINLGWGVLSPNSYIDYDVIPEWYQIERSITFAYRNLCLVVSPRLYFEQQLLGENESFSFLSLPSDYGAKDRVFSIGGYGLDGRRASSYNGNVPSSMLTSSGGPIGSSFSYLGRTDVLAPCIDEHTVTTIRNFVDDSAPIGVGTYTNLGGNSVAAAHASGAAALLMSMHNVENGYPNNLSPEDIQSMFGYYATDVVSDNTPIQFGGDFIGLDPVSGYGRINPPLTLEMSHLPEFCILHSENIQNLAITESYVDQLLGIAGSGPNGGSYYSRAVTRTIYGTLDGDMEILHAWGRNSGSNGLPLCVSNGSSYSYNYLLDPVEYVSFNIGSNLQSFTIVVKFVCNFLNTNGLIEWCGGQSPASVKTPFSLHVRHTEASITTDINNKFVVQPNPLSSSCQVILNRNDMTVGDSWHYHLADISGRTLSVVPLPKNEFIFDVDLTACQSGVYIITVTNGGQIFGSTRIIKL